jgi:thiol-disulfide isomerase/thioredoxin
MKKLAVIASLFVMSVWTTASAAPEDRWLYDSAGYARALDLQRELNVPLVVYFYTDWCPFCQALDSDYLSASSVQQYLRGVVKVRINPEHGPSERGISNQYGVTGYPSFFVMRNLSSAPRNIQPFRRGGANLSPVELARAWQDVAPISTPSAAARTNVPSSGNTAATRPQLQAQIVNVPPSSGPTFITDTPLPTLNAVLAKYVAAIGGRDANRKITSRVCKGRVDVPGVSFGGKVEVYAKAPNKSLTVMNVEPLGLVKQGFDGRSGWNSSVNGLDVPNVADPAAVADADFYREIRLPELYGRMKLLGKTKAGFREVYMVEATPRGGTPENFYFDVESGLLVRRDLLRPTSRGLVRAEVYFSDWRDVDGVKIPFKLTQVMPTMRFVTTFEDVKQNVPVDDTLFVRP